MGVIEIGQKKLEHGDFNNRSHQSAENFPTIRKSTIFLGLISVLMTSCSIFLLTRPADSCNPITPVVAAEGLNGSYNGSSAVRILESLKENDKISGENWQAWKSIYYSNRQHICKWDIGVDGSDGNYVLKKYNIDHKYSLNSPRIKLDVVYQVPEGHRQIGVVAIDHWLDGTGGSCSFQLHNNTVQLRSRLGRGLHFYILIVAESIKPQ